MKKFIIVLVGTILLGISGAITIHNLSVKNTITPKKVENQNIPIKSVSSKNQETENISNKDYSKEKSMEEVKEIPVLNINDKTVKQEDKTKKATTKTSTQKEENKVDSRITVSTNQDSIKENETSNKENVSNSKNDIAEIKKEETKKPEIVKFYESITHGIKEFASESEAFNKGLEIAKKELNYVLDYNEQHPEEQIQPDIRYYRVYPSIIDENGNTWYYLHFFCNSGEGNDVKLKNMFK